MTKKQKKLLGQLVNYDGRKSTRKYIYKLVGPDGWPIYVGQTGNERQRFSAHSSSSSSCSFLKSTLEKLKESHPKWKACDNFVRIECVKSGVPNHLADKYEGFFIAGIENATVPGTRTLQDFPWRSNMRDGPNWTEYHHDYHKMETAVQKAVEDGVELDFEFKSEDKFDIKDPAYEDAYAQAAVMQAASDHLKEIDSQPSDEFTARFELVTRTVANHESVFTLNTALNNTIAAYKAKEEQKVDGQTFIAQWNHAKNLIEDYFPNENNMPQKLAHNLVISAYKHGIRLIGNGDFNTKLNRTDVINFLGLLKSIVDLRSATGGLPPRSFKSMMAWCKLDSDLAPSENAENKLKRLRQNFEQRETSMNDFQKAELEARYQACIQRIRRDKENALHSENKEQAETTSSSHPEQRLDEDQLQANTGVILQEAGQ